MYGKPEGFVMNETCSPSNLFFKNAVLRPWSIPLHGIEPPLVVELATTDHSALALAGEVLLSCPLERQGGCSSPGLHKPWQHWACWAPLALGNCCSPQRGRRLFLPVSHHRGSSPRGHLLSRWLTYGRAYCITGTTSSRSSMALLALALRSFVWLSVHITGCSSLSWSLRYYCGALKLGPGTYWLYLRLQNVLIHKL